MISKEIGERKMETEQKQLGNVNWNEEFTKLRQAEEYERLDWFKPSMGSYKIKRLSDGFKYSFLDNKTNQKVDKVRFDVEVAGKKLSWGITEGSTKDSLYGQIVTLIAKNIWEKDKEITLVAAGQGKARRYSILEAMDLMKKEEKSSFQSNEEEINEDHLWS